MIFNRNTEWRRKALSGAIAAALALAAADALGISQSGESQNMMRVGHTDLQGRPTYQPNVIEYPDGRTMLFAGMHGGVPTGRATNCPVNAQGVHDTLEDPLNNNACENNGTMIIDVTDPRNPVELHLIPAPTGGQAQMVRMCLGSELPGGVNGHVYLLRNVQGGSQAGYQMYDVTDPKKPVLKKKLTGIRSTHKDWIECSTGIAYMPGSKNTVLVAGTPLWRQSQSMLIYDWSNPENGQDPVYIRTFGLPGGQPNSSGPPATSLHGALSAHDHPLAKQKLARGQDVIGNRVYAAWGVGNDGIVTILDRNKLLPFISDGHGGNKGGAWTPKTANSLDAPLEEELIGQDSPTVGYFMMSPDQGGHTSYPIFGLKPPSMQSFKDVDDPTNDAANDLFTKRDIVVVASEATADGKGGFCPQPPHYAFTLDVTVENSMASPPSTRVEHDKYQGPMVLGTMSVDPRAGEQYKRGNYCARGARFGVHSTNENFRNPYDGKMVAIAYFNGGVRLYDIREPQAPREVAFYVPEADALTDTDGYMTNNVEIDNRGYIYVVDRNGAGMDILQLTGCAKQVSDKGTVCPDLANNNAGK
ncbi:MAG TPA: hypothetical protein VFQ93_15175 [Casimicrobiaceae bacterium]|nr:hypothetical protein [Casimicrobiaceae bacterium]